MKIAVISDIHANPKALLKVIHSARRLGCTSFICCGDIVGYGYAPNECIEICKKNDIECIKGNHDAALVGELSLDWFNHYAAHGIISNRPLVTEGNKKWLANLPYKIEKQFGDTKVAFSHGTYAIPEQFGYIDDMYSAMVEMDLIRKNGIDALFIGHTHGAELYARNTFDDRNLTYGTLPKSLRKRLAQPLNGWSEAIFNVGSVGYPRRCRYSTYAIIDDSIPRVTWRQLPFDYVGYTEKIVAMGREIPVWLAARMSYLTEDEQ